MSLRDLLVEDRVELTQNYYVNRYRCFIFQLTAIQAIYICIHVNIHAIITVFFVIILITCIGVN